MEENCTRECLYVFARWLPVKQNICDHTVALGRERERDVWFGSFCWRADCMSWNGNSARMYKYSEEQKAQKSIFISGPNPKASCGFSNQSSNDSTVSHREEKSRKAAGESESERHGERNGSVAKSLAAKSSQETPNSHWLMCLKHTLCTRNVQIYYRHFDCICLLQFFCCRNTLWGQNNHRVSPRLFI